MSYVCESDILWKVRTIWISRVLPLLNFKRLDILCPRIRHRSEMLWPFDIVESFRCSISSVSIYYAPELDFRVKCYDHLNFKRASFVQLRASQYIIHLNRTSEWKVMTIWVYRELPLSISSISIYYIPESDIRVKSYDYLNSQELPLIYFEHLDILCARIRHPSEKLWPIGFLESFHC